MPFQLNGVGITGTYAEAATIPIGSLSPPPGWDSSVGFSISEPIYSSTNYYPPPTNPNAAMGGLIEAYGDPADSDPAKKCLDQPLDTAPGLTADAFGATRPILDDNIAPAGTYANYKTLVLQRVADPTQNYDADTNPYITVDWMPIDLTVYNGDDKPAGGTMLPANKFDPDDPTFDSPKNLRLGTRQRGMLTAPMGTDQFNIWAQNSYQPSAAPGAGAADSVFSYTFDAQQSMGRLNACFGTTPAGVSPAVYGSAPQRAFPNLQWNNRPYLNPYEIMNVPASHPGRLFMEFSVSQNATQEYYSGNGQAIIGPSGHLLNFFHGSAVGTNDDSGNFYRILDWLTTGSKFAGTETWLKPTDAASVTATTDPALTQFKPPFNYVPHYREPGKMNLNTINSPRRGRR
ncbi:MAG: hypothetical protein QM811_12765 [Pirellulales bacterium]